MEFANYKLRSRYPISTALVTCDLIYGICVSVYLFFLMQAESISSFLETSKRMP